MSYFLNTLLASAVLLASPAAAQQHDHDKPESDQQTHHHPMHAAPHGGVGGLSRCADAA